MAAKKIEQTKNEHDEPGKAKAEKKARRKAKELEKAEKKAKKLAKKLDKKAKKTADKKAKKTADKKAEKKASKPEKSEKAKKGKSADPAKRRTPEVPLLRLTLLDREGLGVPSASGIAALGGGLSLVIDDDDGIYLTGGAAGPKLLRGRGDHAGLGDLESVCVSEDGRTAYAVSEDAGQVFAFTVSRGRGSAKLSAPSLLGVLPRPGGQKNKGWEGASYLAPSDHGTACLILAHERSPKAIGVFSLPDLREVRVFALDGVIAELLDDVADVAVCPTTDHIFLLSDEAQRVVEARLDLEAGTLTLLGSFDLPLEKGEKPEGIAFESKDRLVIVTDASSRLYRFALERPSP
jgi:hypothetical protein